MILNFSFTLRNFWLNFYISSIWLLDSNFDYLLLILFHFTIIEQLLEATARAVQPVLEWGESGLSVADGLLNLLKVKTGLSITQDIVLQYFLS